MVAAVFFGGCGGLFRDGGEGRAEGFSGLRRGFSDEAGRGCPAGRRIGSGQPPAQHKSIAGGCLLPGARCHCADQEPESRDAGVSRFSENGSHLAEADAAEGHARQVDGSGSSGNAGTGSHLEVASVTDAAGVHVSGPGSSEFAENGSHPAAADFSDEPEAVLWRRPPPSRRTESGLLSYGTASPDSSVQKTALWCTRGSS